jgi:hypothetical protein
VWAEMGKNLAPFETGVLNFKDAEGYPYSVRCTPRLDPEAGVIRLGAVGEEAFPPGPATLLCHGHDEELWNLEVFLLRGAVEEAGGERVFRPERQISGTGLGGAARMLIGARRSARAYLKKRGLPRPRIPWDEIEAIKERQAR